MCVYVDELFRWDMTNKPSRVAARGDTWCHLLGDDLDELVEFAVGLDLQPEWMHRHRHRWRNHFDLTPPLRRRAVEAGAVELSWHDLGDWLHRQRTRSLTGAVSAP